MARDPLVEQCTARAKRTGGQRCRIRVRGGGVCRWHGETKAARAKRMERISMAEALAADPRRHPGEVLLDVGHQFDYVMRKAREEISANHPSVETLQNLLDLSERAERSAGRTLAAGIEERSTRLAELQGALVGDVIRAIIGDLQLSDSQWELVGEVVPRHLKALTQ